MTEVLIASPVRQEAAILNCFLDSLRTLDTENLNIDYCFINDNHDKSSEKLLKNFRPLGSRVEIIDKIDYENDYYKDDLTHYWHEELIWKVAGYKNMIIDYCLENSYDYLFLLDSDLVLHPDTLQRLIICGKDIISELFWTKFHKNGSDIPQVWLRDSYTLFNKARNEKITKEEVNKRANDFLNKLRRAGVYKVGGLGACTLFKRKVLEKGVNFSEIYNLSFFGEDRHLCIRAAALGYDLHVDTCYPAYHIYRKKELEGVNNYISSFSRRSSSLSAYDLKNKKIYFPHSSRKEKSEKKYKGKLTLASIIYNEERRYLKRCLEHAVKYIDEAVILDDGSTDNSVDICKEILKEIPLTIKSIPHIGFKDELTLRKKLWQMVEDGDVDWVLYLDADELFEDKAVKEIRQLINDKTIDIYSFRLYDFWDEEHYREDEYWNAHLRYSPFLIRYQQGFNYTWNNKKLHCGRFPSNIYSLPMVCSDLRLKHYSWSREGDRKSKYEKYMKLDPGAKYGIMEQYLSILDSEPNLIKWKEK
ncbi:MAG: glycosyltransferase family 2 protein [Halanaerobiales bacterium]